MMTDLKPENKVVFYPLSWLKAFCLHSILLHHPIIPFLGLLSEFCVLFTHTPVTGYNLSIRKNILLSFWAGGHLAYYYVSQTMYFSTNFMIPFSFPCSPWAMFMLCLLMCLYSYVLLSSVLIPSSYATAELLMMPLTVHYTTPLRASIWTTDLLLPLQISVTISIHNRFLKFFIDITFFYICPITKFNRLNVAHLLII